MYKVMVQFKERFCWQCVKIIEDEQAAYIYAKKYVDLSSKPIDDIKIIKLRTEIE